MTRPVHISIRDDLRIRLTSGEWIPGQRLPSESELANWYGVARMTVRQAIGALASEGVLVRKQGLGTFVADRLPTRHAGWLQSFSDEMREQGHEVQTVLVQSAVVQPHAAARLALQLGSSAASILVRRVRLIDSQPVLLQTSWLPCARFTGLDADPLLNGSLYAMLEGPYGVRITRARQIFTAAAIDDGDAHLLGLQPQEPVLRIVRTTYDSSNLVVEYAVSSTRPGYPIETIMERKPLPARHDQLPITETPQEDRIAISSPSSNGAVSSGLG
jgi:GntR family transcriptional regulator